jgi:D-xylulose reductase
MVAEVSLSGCGPVGLFIMLVAKAYGASKIIGFDISASRLAAARKLVATHVVDTRARPEDVDPLAFAQTEARRALDEAGIFGVGVDIVVEASGAPPAMRTGAMIAKAGGICKPAFSMT